MPDPFVPKSDLGATERPRRDLARAVPLRDGNGTERLVLAWGQMGVPNTGIVRYPPRSTLGPRAQQDYQLVLVHAGYARVTVDGRTRDIPPGHVGLLLPGRTELYVFSAERETRHSWLAAPPAALLPDLCASLDAALPMLPLSDGLVLAAELAREAAALDTSSAFPILGTVVRAAFTIYVAEAARRGNGQAAEHPAVRRATEVARSRAWEGIGVGDLAREVGLSPEHLARLFRRERGGTPGALLREERVRHATQLLEHTGMPIADVARRSGFVSSQHFSRAIRAATGMTPNELRAHRWDGAATEPRQGAPGDGSPG